MTVGLLQPTTVLLKLFFFFIGYLSLSKFGLCTKTEPFGIIGARFSTCHMLFPVVKPTVFEHRRK